MASANERIEIDAPGQPWTDFSPASRSTHSVSSAGSVSSCEVLPTPDGPNSATVVLPLASARRWSAGTIRNGIDVPYRPAVSPDGMNRPGRLKWALTAR